MHADSRSQDTGHGCGCPERVAHSKRAVLQFPSIYTSDRQDVRSALAPGLYPEIIQHPLHIISRRPPMRAGNVSVLLVPPPISTPGKRCRPRDRHRLRPQQGLPTHPILTVADHHFTRYPLTHTTAAPSKWRQVLKASSTPSWLLHGHIPDGAIYVGRQARLIFIHPHRHELSDQLRALKRPAAS
jgi:hypothetical protein